MRKLLVLAIAVVSALAVTATTAQAQTPITVVDPPTQIPCDEVTGGCVIDMQGGFSVSDGYSNCASEFDLRFGSAGELYVEDGETGGVACFHDVSCSSPWSGQIRALGDEVYEADMEICIRHTTSSTVYPLWVEGAEVTIGDGGWIPTTLTIESEDVTTECEHYFGAGPQCPRPNQVLDGTWSSTGNEAVAILVGE